MADYNTMAVELGSRFIPERSKPRNFDEDFAEGVGVFGAMRRGASMNEAQLEGIRAKEASKDPMFALKVLELQSRINENAAQTASQVRTLLIRNEQLKQEQADENYLAGLKDMKGLDDRMEYVANMVPASEKGRLTQHQLISGFSEIKKRDYVTRIKATSPANVLIDASAFEEGSPEWLAAIKLGNERLAAGKIEAQKQLITARGEVQKQLAAMRQPKAGEHPAITALRKEHATIQKAFDAAKAQFYGAKGTADEAAAQAIYNARFVSLKEKEEELDEAIDKYDQQSVGTANSNVTQEEYERLKPGDLFWWNGKQIPKK